MEDEALFHHNLERWSHDDPKTSTLLPYHVPRDIVFCQTRRGEANLCRTVEGKTLYYHSSHGAEEEANRWFAHTDIPDVHVLYVYGVGLGYYYHAVKPWLDEKPERHLVFFEDDLSVIYCLFQTPNGAAILNDPRVKLLYFEDLEKSKELFDALFWNFVMTKMAISSLKLYSKMKRHRLVDLKYKITYDSAMNNALVREYVQFGAPFFKNYYPNLLCLAQSRFGNRLFGAFKDVPAIVCGAGPSLGKQLPLLKTLHDKALIFAGGSSLNALNAAGIEPHFGAGIDPNPTQQDRFSTSQAFEVPFFYRNRLYHPAFCHIHGERLYVSGTGGYDIADYFDDKFGLNHDFIDEGHNVVNFTIQLAYQLGCNPIICLGVDLAYTNMRLYSKGVIAENKVQRTEIIQTDNVDTTAFKRKDVYGKSIYTVWKWIAEADWIGQFAKEREGLTLINCTEGGIGFPGIPNRPFKEMVDLFLTKQYNLKDWIHGEICNSALKGLSFETILEDLEQLKSSLERSIANFQTLWDDAVRLIDEIEKNDALPETTQGGLAALAEIELEDEIGYQYVLDIFNHVFSRILNREYQALRLGIYALTDQQKAVEKLKINCKKFSFLIEVAKVNIQFIDNAIQEKTEAYQKGDILGS